MTDPRIVTEALGGSPLSRAVQTGALEAPIFVTAPRSAVAWRAHARTVAAGAERDWFAGLREAFGGRAAALDRLERASRQRGVVVTTGQQPGLFGGPIYTWSKALSALALADALERETGVPTAPVFWAATDDADFDEASRTSIIVDGALQALESTTAPAAGTPMALAPLGEMGALLSALRKACGSMAYERAYAAVGAAYGAGGTVGAAYVELLRALLEPLGIAVLDASHPAVRTAGVGVLRRALAGAGKIGAALDARHAWLVERGFDPQVAEVPELSTVFVHERGPKRRVPFAEAASLATTAAAESLSPNVLLRPVLERAILPTVGYVAGPGELAYFAQVSAVAEALGAAQPVAVPRWSCTIVEPGVDRALSRLGVGIDELRDSTALERRIARDAVPEAVRGALSGLRSSVSDGLARLQQRVRESGGDPLLDDAVVEGAGRQLGFRIDRLERRVVAAAKRRGSDALRDLRTARSALWPGGHRQERTLNFIPLLARYGKPLLAALGASAARHASRLVTGASDGG
jgi:bacillithiol synthase